MTSDKRKESSEKRKEQYREASKKYRKERQDAGWERIWIPPQLLKEVKLMIKKYLKSPKEDKNDK